MNVTAVLAIRNEEAYLANCLRDLISNGLDFVVIDNDSTDSSAQIYGRSEFAAHLVRVCRLPFSGAFSLSEQLQRKMEIIEALNSDWVVHVDADEIMHSYREGEGLREALSRLDAMAEFYRFSSDHAAYGCIYFCVTEIELSRMYVGAGLLQVSCG